MKLPYELLLIVEILTLVALMAAVAINTGCVGTVVNWLVNR